MSQGHSQEEILSLMKQAEVAAIATAAGDKVRTRMMHFAAADDFTVYLATMKGDPKTVQITHQPSISILVHRPGDSITESREVEVTGKALLVRDSAERQHALEMTAQKSPVVKHLKEAGNTDILDTVKVVPETIKLRVFKEIVQGMPPTVIEFPQNRQVVSDWPRLMMKTRNWLIAVRGSFLTASLIPMLLGTAVAWSVTGSLHWGYFVLTLLAGLLVQAGTNIINDYFDHRSGNDEVNYEFVRPFSGGSRVIQLGLLSPLEVLTGSLALLALSSAIGIYLAWARGPFLLVLGAIGLVSGVFYSGNPFNWARRGVGEAVVALNFGVLMTLGAYYVQAQALSWLPVIASLPVAGLIGGVLYINEFPDYASDAAVGKRTLVVRLGRQHAVALYAAIMAGTYAALVAGVASGALPVVALLALGSLPLVARAYLYARRHHSQSFDLVPANAMTIICHLTVGLVLTLAFVWNRSGAQGVAYLVPLAAAFAGFVAYMYWYIERQKNIFLKLKKAVA